MIKYISGLPVELQITSFKCVTRSIQPMPFQMEDAMRPDCEKESDVGHYEGNDSLANKRSDGLPTVGLENRLDYRWIDLRTPANQGIFRIESMVGVLFRGLLVDIGIPVKKTSNVFKNFTLKLKIVLRV